VWKNEKFDNESLMELYENYLIENGAGKFDKWMTIVEESIKTCTKLSEKKNNLNNLHYVYFLFQFSVPKSNEIYSCNIPTFVMDIMDCVTHMNFINCPNYNVSEKCQDLRKFVTVSKDCGKKVNGTFIVDYRLFEEKKEKNKNKT
jgi:hypothetical protein